MTHGIEPFTRPASLAVDGPVMPAGSFPHAWIAMADETNTIEELIADIRRRLCKMPRVIPVFESVVEHLSHADMSEAEYGEVVQWLHFAVRSPRMAELVYCMARLVTQRDPKKPAAPSMRN